MKRLLQRFGKFIIVSFVIIAIGIIAFLLTPVLYSFWGIDSDLIGLVIAVFGLALFVIGMIRKKRPHGWKLALLIVLAVVLFLPVLQLVVSLVYYLTTGKPIGE